MTLPKYKSQLQLDPAVCRIDRKLDMLTMRVFMQNIALSSWIQPCAGLTGSWTC